MNLLIYYTIEHDTLAQTYSLDQPYLKLLLASIVTSSCTTNINYYTNHFSCSQKARPPNVKPPEYLILERRKKEDMLENYRKNTQYMEFNDLKNEWERSTDRKIKLNTVKRKLDSLLLDSQFTIEDRRERYQKVVIRI